MLARQEEEGLCNTRERQEFDQLLGSLNWFNISTRPDLAITCSLAGRVASNPTKSQLKQQLRRVIGYLKRYPKKELVCDGSKCNA